jgi:uncharacterized damage-inducible protein DinB
MMDNTSAVTAYLAGPQELRVAIVGLSRDQLIARPIPGKWSILEVVAHLADTEANIAHRLKRVLTEDHPEFDRFKPDRFLAELSYHSRDVDDEITLIELTRRQIASILQNSPPEVWERAGIVNERGTRTVAQMLSGAIEHLKHHLPFIDEKRSVLVGSPGAGSLSTPTSSG